MSYVDFTILYRQECCKAKPPPFHYALSTYTQTIWPDEPARDICGCKGFSFRRDCKHVKEGRELAAKESGCWHEEDSPEQQTPEQANNFQCPVCGGPTRMVRIAA